MKKLKFLIPAFLVAVFLFACAKEEVPTQYSTSLEQVQAVTQNKNALKQNISTTIEGDKDQSLAATALPPWSFAIRVQGATTPQTIYMHEVGSAKYFPITSSTAYNNINAFYFTFDWPNLYTKIDRNKTYELCFAPVIWTGHMTRFKFDTCYPSWSGNYVNSSNIERLWYIAGNSKFFLYAYPTITCGTIQIL